MAGGKREHPESRPSGHPSLPFWHSLCKALIPGSGVGRKHLFSTPEVCFQRTFHLIRAWVLRWGQFCSPSPPCRDTCPCLETVLVHTTREGNATGIQRVECQTSYSAQNSQPNKELSSPKHQERELENLQDQRHIPGLSPSRILHLRAAAGSPRLLSGQEPCRRALSGPAS